MVEGSGFRHYGLAKTFLVKIPWDGELGLVFGGAGGSGLGAFRAHILLLYSTLGPRESRKTKGWV